MTGTKTSGRDSIQSWFRVTEGRSFLIEVVLALNLVVLFLSVGVSTYAILRANDVSLASAIFSIVFWISNFYFGFFAISYTLSYRRSHHTYERPMGPAITLGHRLSVAIFVPIYNEAFSLIENNLVAIMNAAGRLASVYVLDDSTNADVPRVQELTSSLGATYIHRENRRGYKAGALNDALAQTGEEYVAVLDIDQMPAPDFLRMVTSVLDGDRTIGFVQVPQEYANTDASLLARLSAAQQFIFYEILTEGKSVAGTLFSCGTNVVYRRDALASVGNFDEISLVEDMATSTHLIEKGWKGLYLNRKLVYGRAPVTMTGYVNQQWRWARGTLGLLPSVCRRFVFGRDQSLSARIDWLGAATWYLYGWFYLAFLLAPILVVLGVHVLVIPPWLYLVAWLPYAIFDLGFFAITQISRGGTLATVYHNLAANVIMFPVGISASLSSLTGRRRPFTTARTGGRLPWYRFAPQFAIMASLAIAFPFLIIDGGWYGYVTAFWAGFQFALFLPIFWLNRAPRVSTLDLPMLKKAAG